MEIGTNYNFHTKNPFEISSAQWGPFCLDLNVLSVHCFINTDLASQLHKAGVPMIKASDKTGAADAVVRLQQVYNISVDDLASGSVKGYQGRPPTVPEMGEVGTMWATARDHKKALEWFELALHQSGTSLSSEDSQWLIQAANSYFMVSP